MIYLVQKKFMHYMLMYMLYCFFTLTGPIVNLYRSFKPCLHEDEIFACLN